jgi:hypothetical protein
MDASSAIQANEAAFPLQPLPEMSLHQAHLSDDSMSREITDQEWAAAGQLDSGRTWREFTDEELMSCDAALSHFDEPSFVYYLPAFLLFSIHFCNVEWSHPAWGLVGGTVFSVTHRSPYSLSRYKSLSPAQRSAVVHFLELIVANGGSNADDAQKALDRYWKTDEASRPLVGP